MLIVLITLRVVFANVAHPSLLKVRITVQGMSASQCDKVRLTDLVLANNLGGTTLECNDQYFSDPLCQRFGGCESRIASGNSQCSLLIGHVRSAKKMAQRSMERFSLGDAASGIRKEAKACEGIKKKLLEDGHSAMPCECLQISRSLSLSGGMCHLIFN